MRISKVEAQALAAFVSRIRDDWQQPGIVAAIEKAAPLGSPAAIGAALCRLAENLELRTPALLAEAGPHWSGTSVAKLTPPVMCPDHPAQPARECRDCRELAERTDHSAGAAAVRAEMKRRARTARRPEQTPDTDRIEQVRKQLDAEEAHP